MLSEYQKFLDSYLKNGEKQKVLNNSINSAKSLLNN